MSHQQTIEECPFEGCVQTLTHQHGTDRLYAGKQAPGTNPRGTQPGTLEYLMEQCFDAGVRAKTSLEVQGREATPTTLRVHYEAWRRSYLYDGD